MCDAIFSRRYTLKRHITRLHNRVQQVLECTLCGAHFSKLSALRKHRRRHKPSTSFQLRNSAFRKSCVTYRKVYDKKILSYEEAAALDRPDIRTLLRYELAKRKQIKVCLISTIEFVKASVIEDEPELTYEIAMRACSHYVRHEMDIEQFINRSESDINNRIDDFINNGSGWTFDEVLFTDLEFGTCVALNGNCNSISVKSISDLERVQPVDNLQDCFVQAVAYHFVKNKSPKKLRRFIRKKMISETKLPMSLIDIRKFEADNAHLRLKLNVLYSEDLGKTVSPVYTSKSASTKNIINLILWKTIVDGKVVNHYSYIEDLGKFLRKKYEAQTDRVCYQKLFVCGNCLCCFYSLPTLQSHEAACLQQKTQEVIVPPNDSTIRFRNFKKQFKVRYTGFFDFESYLEPVHPCEKCSDISACTHRSLAVNEQKPITYSFLIIDSDNCVVYRKTYSGEDCVSHFLDELLAVEKELIDSLCANVPMQMTLEEQQEFYQSEVCHICHKNFGNELSVRDHCHITGKYLGAAHNLCNLQRQEAKFIPMFAHNFTSYDSHFLMQHLKKDPRIHKITALPLNTEKFRTIQMNSFHFIDSLSFLNASLAELVSDLVTEKKEKREPFSILDQMDLYDNNSQQELLLRKGVFPYEYVTSFNTLLQTKNIPPKNQFYSKLTNCDISEQDHKHAQTVFDIFDCDNMKDYCELYCATDVGLLAEVMVQFRKTIYNIFGLDCCHYISLPQLAYDSMLKLTDVEIELMSDVDMVLFFERSIRGGVSFINQRHCKMKEEEDDHVDMIYIDGKFFLLLNYNYFLLFSK
jgi:hypothetical protein